MPSRPFNAVTLLACDSGSSARHAPSLRLLHCRETSILNGGENRGDVNTTVRQGLIVYEMAVTSLTGVSKLSQNKPAKAILGVPLALSQSDDTQARALGLTIAQDPKPQS